jgi:hypothetical protein
MVEILREAGNCLAILVKVEPKLSYNIDRKNIRGNNLSHGMKDTIHFLTKNTFGLLPT